MGTEGTLMGRIARRAQQGQVTAALEELEGAWRSGSLGAELQGEYWALKLAFLEDLSRFGEAYSHAQTYLNQHTPETVCGVFALKLTLAELAERLDKAEDAIRWYTEAIEDFGRTRMPSAAVPVLGLIRVRSKDLTEMDRSLCSRALLMSWERTGHKGVPNLADLSALASRLAEGSGP